jgi:hypothetical protein
LESPKECNRDEDILDLTIIDNEKRGLPPSMVSQEETKVDERRGGGRKRKNEIYVLEY